MTTKLEKLNQKFNEEFREKLRRAFLTKFRTHIVSDYDLFAMRLVTTRRDKKPFTLDQKKFLKAYETGYNDAWDILMEQNRIDMYANEARRENRN